MAQIDYIELLNEARRGDKKAIDGLAELAANRLRVYIYRLTLAEDLTQEIVQETMLEMFKILGKLNKPDRFWPWLYGIATNKIRRHQRTEQKHKRLAKSKAEQSADLHQREQGFRNLVGRELKQIVAAAMRNLKTTHRAVLVMRCYDQMSYAEIADSMGTSEFGTRMLFLRAKKALQKQLARNGFGKGSLLAALVLFGKMTAPTEAAAAQVSVTAATTSVGLVAGIVGLAITKTAIISLSGAGIIAGAVAVKSGLPGAAQQTAGQFAGVSQPISSLGYQSTGHEEYWYYFPDGAEKPMMMRVKDSQKSDTPRLQYLQNDNANYCFENGTVYINNHRMYAADLTVAKLPTDDPQFTDFLTQTEPGRGIQKMQYVPDTTKGLFIITASNGGTGPETVWATKHYNVLEEDYFQADWPAELKTIDNRDRMHKRGWTWFNVTGSVNGQVVSAVGRIPFVYAETIENSPWIKLTIAGGVTAVDSPDQTSISKPDSTVINCKPGAFFEGLAKPWLGLHTIDTVRRDAARYRIPFETELIDNNRAKVTLTAGKIQLLCSIDLEADLLDEIEFFENGASCGLLTFEYLQDVTGLDDRFVCPKTPAPRGDAAQKDTALPWLFRLAEGSLAK
ncbi:MAG: sigma-70 family RNA polymerase sigma factor [Sedimentisphaerales bacterium]|nr:sigma-70 family RNA polymerase sigma factor [Sedimentisphaerales bacterium]